MRANVDLINGPIDSSLRRIALPMALSFIVNMLCALIDRYFVSKLGDSAIAAMGSVDQVYFFMFTLASGFAVGSGIIVARRIGEGNRYSAQRTATQAVVWLMGLSLIVMVGMMIAIPSIPGFFQLDDVVAGFATSYMSALFLGYVANVVNFQMFSIIQATGNAFYPTSIFVLVTVINGLLAPTLIFGLGPIPAMGIQGAGAATSIAQGMGLIGAIWLGMSGKAGLKFDFSNFKLDPSIIKRIMILGVPSSLQMLSVSMSRILILKTVAGFSTAVVAAYTLGLQIDMFVFMCVFAMAMSVEVTTGQNLGARQVDRVFAYHRSGVRQITILMLLFMALIWVGGVKVISLFTSTPDTLYEVSTYLNMAVVGYIFFAIGMVTVRVISGAGASFTSLVVTSVALIGVQVPLAVILSDRYQQTGIWLAGVLAYMAYAAAAYSVLRTRFWLKAQI